MPDSAVLEVGIYRSNETSAGLPARDFAPLLGQAGIHLQDCEEGDGARFAILLIDRREPDLLERIQALSANGQTRLLVLSPQRLPEQSQFVWQALNAGASDVLVWDQVADPARAIAERFRRWYEIDRLVELPLIQNHLVGESRNWKLTLRRIVEAARFSTWPVLLTGETGTGKELAARLIHTLDPARNKAEVVTVDCTTIVPELSGSELFGHERGAYTGAVAARDGAFAIANGGTLLLDEIGELQPNLQVQLLRVLQEHTYKRVGSNTWQKTDFRLVSATNRDLQIEASGGRFRTDLYHRVASIKVHLPPLRDRIEDILPLARHVIGSAFEGSDTLPELDESVELYLLSRDYPGNVRDLTNLMHRILARHVGNGPITAGDIPPEERPETGLPLQSWCNGDLESLIRQAFASGAGLRDIRRAVENAAIRIAMEEEDGNLRRAAQRLSLTDRALQKRRAEQRRADRAA